MGRPVIASSPALQGLDVAVGEHVLQADSPDEWCQRASTLLSDARAAAELGRSARCHVMAKYSWDARLRPLVELCSRLAEAGAAAAALEAPVLPLPATERAAGGGREHAAEAPMRPGSATAQPAAPRLRRSTAAPERDGATEQSATAR